MNYQQAYNKIIDAYFKDEIKPMNAEFCFCGTLSPDGYWYSQYIGSYPYSVDEYNRMENALFARMGASVIKNPTTDKGYEKKLFNGMCAALEVLKQIHKERGENVDEEIPFIKRELQPA